MYLCVPDRDGPAPALAVALNPLPQDLIHAGLPARAAGFVHPVDSALASEMGILAEDNAENPN